MLIDPKNLELFVDFSQNIFGGKTYDFHNDFICEEILYRSFSLSSKFVNTAENLTVTLIFHNVSIEMMEISTSSSEKVLTLDNLYRGRFELDGELVEFSKNGKSYFYIEFLEGVKIELLCDSVELKQIIKDPVPDRETDN